MRYSGCQHVRIGTVNLTSEDLACPCTAVLPDTMCILSGKAKHTPEVHEQAARVLSAMNKLTSTACYKPLVAPRLFRAATC